MNQTPSPVERERVVSPPIEGEKGGRESHGTGVASAASIDQRTVERNGDRGVVARERTEVRVEPTTVQVPEPEPAAEPEFAPEPAETPAVEPASESRLRAALARPGVRGLLLALPVALVALWAVLFVPLELGVALGAWALLPISIVAVPWLVSLAMTALLDR